MKKFMKRFQHGQGGFTLIELLVVVAILGILAAVIVPNVGRFMGKGAAEAANTEQHNVQLAVMAAMADNNITAFAAVGTVGPDTDMTPPVKGNIQGSLQATYTINTDGSITNAVKVADGKWKNLTWNTTGWK